MNLKRSYYKKRNPAGRRGISEAEAVMFSSIYEPKKKSNFGLGIRGGMINSMKNKQGFSGLASIIIIAVLAIGGYFVYKNQVVAPADGTIDMTNWQTYRNDKYGFEFQYPTRLIFSEVSDGSLNSPCVWSAYFVDKQESEKLSGLGDVSGYLDLCIASSLTKARNKFAVQWKVTEIGTKVSAFEGDVLGRKVVLIELANEKGLTIYNPSPLPSLPNPHFFDQLLSTFKFTK